MLKDDRVIGSALELLSQKIFHLVVRLPSHGLNMNLDQYLAWMEPAWRSQ
jgi:hypothetical protein